MSDPIVLGFPRSTFVQIVRLVGGKGMYPKYSAFCRWRERMEALPTVQKLRAALPPPAPIEHARQWAISHRPKY